jgi:hypothetical protein
MQAKHLTRIIALLAIAPVSLGLTACGTSSQGQSSRKFGNSTATRAGGSKSLPSIATAPVFNLDLSVDAAYAAIPHRRTVMDFAASNMPDQDKRFLEVAFHVIDQAIRLRVTAYQKFSRGVIDSQFISDMDRLAEYLQNTEAPESLSSYQATLLKALSDQRDFFVEWKAQGQEFRFGSPQTIGTHPKVQSSSAALREAYGILMETYRGEASNNQEAFFDYHCALDFL